MNTAFQEGSGVNSLLRGQGSLQSLIQVMYNIHYSNVRPSVWKLKVLLEVEQGNDAKYTSESSKELLQKKK